MLFLQELGPWCAAAVLMEVLRSKQANKLLDQFDDPLPETKYTDKLPHSSDMRKTPGAYNPAAADQGPPGMPSQAEGQTAAHPLIGQATHNGPQQDCQVRSLPVQAAVRVSHTQAKHKQALLVSELGLSSELPRTGLIGVSSVLCKPAKAFVSTEQKFQSTAQQWSCWGPAVMDLTLVLRGLAMRLKGTQGSKWLNVIPELPFSPANAACHMFKQSSLCAASVTFGAYVHACR